MQRSRRIKLQSTDSQHFEHPELTATSVCFSIRPHSLQVFFFSGYFCKRALVFWNACDNRKFRFLCPSFLLAEKDPRIWIAIKAPLVPSRGQAVPRVGARRERKPQESTSSSWRPNKQSEGGQKSRLRIWGLLDGSGSSVRTNAKDNNTGGKVFRNLTSWSHGEATTSGCRSPKPSWWNSHWCLSVCVAVVWHCQGWISADSHQRPTKV